MLGKLLGVAREIATARLLGASFLADGFRGALAAVLLPMAPAQSDMLPSVLIPLYRDWREQGGPAVPATGLAALLTLLATLIAIAVFALAALWVGLLVGGAWAAPRPAARRRGRARPPVPFNACHSARRPGRYPA